MLLSERRPGNFTCQTSLHTLKFQDVLESNIVINGIATAKYTANKSSCNSLGDRKKTYKSNLFQNQIKLILTTRISKNRIRGVYNKNIKN